MDENCICDKNTAIIIKKKIENPCKKLILYYSRGRIV